jgi:hypothetical protein
MLLIIRSLFLLDRVCARQLRKEVSACVCVILAVYLFVLVP